MSNKLNKEQAEKLIETKTIILDRLLKLSFIIPEPEDKEDINKLMNDIEKITNKYL